MINEERLRVWASPPSETEQTKADNAERIVRDALSAAEQIRHLSFTVFTQGSYRANTNVRLNSDVDVCVLCTNTYFFDLTSHSLTEADAHIVPATLHYPDFRSMVGKALIDRFGAAGVTRGNKAFDVHANTYRLDADVVVAFEHRRFHRLAAGGLGWLSGIEFAPDTGPRIVNWPQQAYDNGVAKNSRTGRRYKAAIRITKRLRDQMQADHIGAAADIGSYLIESLLWNVADDRFQAALYRDMMRNVLADLWHATNTDATCVEWGEVSELKYIFRGTPGLRERVHAFVNAAWSHVDFS